ncbi:MULTISPECIES: FliM/FliN family flagellar motor C-terminal domain-containing protein [Pseudoxanthomonas]|uniref:Flagellar motor switch protein FliN/FliY n=1 Tax=Pseudoxanthomonas winnipegensis TaxID=2480810 RepID=A0AAW8GHD0_9GAMM|nr:MULTISPECIES: FliM/FliN family flagellar motor C-terminal domain-containing protein [Pseudoxanthomonas]MDQ1120660.1 flagellar motor switch protein FliN/FliY [Pseudoxanthomonas winnipegensis]MDQ1133884.1 flagellar motor switch protein FliN/FliY [Pseudoxanthomonas winnipegensis]MDR6139880.1 flagellar motor switch protein FliN/FliY [Pseudoxanthomonas sp. SORGH_AS_0997]
MNEMIKNPNALTALANVERIGHMQVSLCAEVGTASISVQDLLQLQADALVPLNESVEAIITLTLEGKSVARGELIAIGERLGVRIIEVL